MSAPIATSGWPGPPKAAEAESELALNWILFAIALASLVPRIYLGLIQFVAYDGYWHVFTATQDRWANMVLEYKADAHPILYYILLRWVALLGRAPIVYRSISILPGAAAVFLVGKIAEKVCASKVVAVLAAAAYAFAITSIDLSIEVRSYMGCLFFVLLSFNSFLKALAIPEDGRGALHWFSFTFFASIAIGFEYYAILYLAACLGVIAWMVVFDSGSRVRSRLPLLAAALLIPALTIDYFYRTHLRRQPKSFGHVAGFYWDPASGQSRIEFALKNLQNAVAYFMPVQIANRAMFLGVLVLLFLLLIAFALTKKDRVKSLRYRAVLLMPVLLLLQFMVLGLARRYPFGGYMRQQSILAPFLCLCLFVLVDRVISILPSRWLRGAALAATGIAIACSAYVQWNAYPRLSHELFLDDYRKFLAVVPAPGAIYLDQYSLIAYYTHTHTWAWHSGHRQKFDERFQEFQTNGPGGQSVAILRDRSTWNFDFMDPSTYATIAQLMQDFHRSSLSVFYLQAPGSVLPLVSSQPYMARVPDLAAQAGLKVTALYVQGIDFFATFQPK